MKIINIAEIVLLYVVKKYSEDLQNQVFKFDDIVKNFYKFSRVELTDAIRMLESDELLKVEYKEDEPKTCELALSTIKQIEEKTLKDKGYRIFKDLMFFIKK